MAIEQKSLPCGVSAWGWRGLAAAPIALLSGCSDASPEVYPVRGQLFVQGVPAEGALVTLRPIAAEPQNPVLQQWGLPRAEVRSDGSFEMTTWSADDGAPPGAYAICVTWPVLAPPDPNMSERPMTHPDRFQGFYTQVGAAKYKITVEKKTNDLPRCELP